MALCDDYRELSITGSYRDVEFELLRTSDTFGMRGPTHEYPHRQTPLTEFLGRKARRFRVEGFFNGRDCYDRMADLIRAVEIPAPGTLRHPVLGNVSVKVDSLVSNPDQEDKLFEVNFTMECVEAGQHLFPIDTAAFGTQVFAAVETVRTQLQTSFDAAYDLGSLPTYLSTQVLEVASESAETYLRGFPAVVDWTADVSDTYVALERLRDIPARPARNAGTTLIDASQAIGVDYRDGAKETAIARLRTISMFRPSRESVTSTNPVAQRANDAINAVIVTARVAAIAERARLIFEDDTFFDSYSAALAYLSETQTLIGQELLIAIERCDDDLYDAVCALIREISDTVFGLAPSLPTRLLINTCYSMPSTLAAYRANGTVTDTCDLENANPSRSSWFLSPNLEVIRSQT